LLDPITLHSRNIRPGKKQSKEATMFAQPPT